MFASQCEETRFAGFGRAQKNCVITRGSGLNRPNWLFLGADNAVSLFDFGPTAVDINSLGHWTQWCGSEQASFARRDGVPQKKVGVWLRVRDDYADERLLDAAALREIWMEKKSNVIPGVEGGHIGPLGVAALDQIVVITTLRLAAYRVWETMPSAAILEEVSDHVGDLPEEPLSPFELAFVRARQKQARLRSGDASIVR